MRRSAAWIWTFGLVLVGGGLVSRPPAAQAPASVDPSIAAGARQQLLEQPWASRALVTFLRDKVDVRYTNPEKRQARLTPHYAVWAAKSSRAASERSGDLVTLQQPGTYKLGRITDGIFDSLGSDLDRVLGAGAPASPGRPLRIVVTSAQTLSGDERSIVRSPQVFSRNATHAILVYLVPSSEATGEWSPEERVLVLSVQRQ